MLVTMQPEGIACDVTTVTFINEDRVTMMLASWSESFWATDSIPVRVEIPVSILPFDLDPEQAQTISSTGAEQVFFEIRNDLEEADNLQTIFLENPGVLGTIRGMAEDYVAARVMVYNNMTEYEPIQQESLTLHPALASRPDLQINALDLKTEVSVTLSHDEVCVLVFNKD
jgi:hypothetical protein